MSLLYCYRAGPNNNNMKTVILYFLNHATLFKINLLPFLLCVFENTETLPCIKDNNYIAGSSK